MNAGRNNTWKHPISHHIKLYTKQLIAILSISSCVRRPSRGNITDTFTQAYGVWCHPVGVHPVPPSNPVPPLGSPAFIEPVHTPADCGPMSPCVSISLHLRLYASCTSPSLHLSDDVLRSHFLFLSPQHCLSFSPSHFPLLCRLMRLSLLRLILHLTLSFAPSCFHSLVVFHPSIFFLQYHSSSKSWSIASVSQYS